MERETRYIVLKIEDIRECLTQSDLALLSAIASTVDEHRARQNRPPLECVVVEKDWPEYEPVWNMIAERVAGKTIDWIPARDRLPTGADADEFGEVYWCGKEHVCRLTPKEIRSWGSPQEGHWAKTGNVRPAPPTP